MPRGLNPGRRFLLVVVVLLSTPLVCLGVDPRAQKTSAIVLSGAPQLFLDDALVCRTTNLKRVLKQPGKHPQNPVIVPEHPANEPQVIAVPPERFEEVTRALALIGSRLYKLD